MKKRNDFYVGWQEEMPDQTKFFLKKWIGVVSIFILILVLIVVIFQNPFNDHKFELGTVSEIKGTYYHSPVPMLIADPGILPKGLSPNLLLVGYGKFGAEGIMKSIQKKKGNLSGRKVILKGTLIYGASKTLMELTKKENSLLEIIPGPTKSAPPRKSRSRRTVQGEIVDPKCYFGVMKPGEGKVHKSCATRCISGGIPPVLKEPTSDPNHPFRYYIVLGAQGESLNKQILPFIAENVVVNGITNQFQGWSVLYADISDFQFKE